MPNLFGSGIRILRAPQSSNSMGNALACLSLAIHVKLIRDIQSLFPCPYLFRSRVKNYQLGPNISSCCLEIFLSNSTFFFGSARVTVLQKLSQFNSTGLFNLLLYPRNIDLRIVLIVCQRVVKLHRSTWYGVCHVKIVANLQM